LILLNKVKIKSKIVETLITINFANEMILTRNFQITHNINKIMLNKKYIL